MENLDYACKLLHRIYEGFELLNYSNMTRMLPICVVYYLDGWTYRLHLRLGASELLAAGVRIGCPNRGFRSEHIHERTGCLARAWHRAAFVNWGDRVKRRHPSIDRARSWASS